jgi:ribosomal protein S18 acetylase RimI-like enzyme
MPSATVRPLSASDQGFLWEALYVALWDPPEGPRRPRSVLELAHIRIYAENWGVSFHDFGFVAINENGTPVGAVWSRLLLPPNEGGAFFNSSTPQLGIAVLRPFQGRGVGSLLLKHYLAAAREVYPSVSLGVHPANVRAIKLYERFGFSQFRIGGGGYLNMVVRLHTPQSMLS